VPCAAQGKAVAVSVDPDLVASVGDGTVVLYATHCRTADSFQKKYWRTTEELFQYRLHRPDYLHVNYVFEPLQIKQHLLRAMKHLFDLSEDYEDSWSDQHQQFIDGLQRWVRLLRPLSVDKVVKFCSDHSLRDCEKWFLDDVRGRLARGCKELRSRASPIWPVMADNCLRSHRRDWHLSSVGEKTRTPLQLIAVLLEVARRHAIPASLETWLRNGAVDTGGIPKMVEFAKAAVRIPVRKVGKEYRTMAILRINKLAFNPALLPRQDSERAHSLALLAQGYLEQLKTDPVWSAYLQSIVGGDDIHAVVLGVAGRDRLGRTELCRLAACARESPDRSWLLEFALCCLNRNLNDLNRGVDRLIRRRHDVELKQLAAYGDSGIHVIGDLNAGDWERIRPLGAQTQEQTVRRLWSLITAEINGYAKAVRSPISIQGAVQRYVYKRMKTFLSRAPHPLRPAVRENLMRAGFAVEDNPPVPNCVNDIAGGKTGRYEVDFAARRSGTTWYVNIITAQDGNEGHKRKEIAGRQRAAGVRIELETSRASRAEVASVAILDGDWAEEYVDSLYEAGFRIVVPASGWKSALDGMKSDHD
jgi:hypothetical protein